MCRYVWDGKVAASGINPHPYPLDTVEPSSPRDPNWRLINDKELGTGYPPLMELLSEFLYLSFRSVPSYKVTFFLFDLATICAIFWVLKELKLDVRNLLIYAWAPLPIIKISQMSHNNSMAAFLVLLFFLLLLR